MPKEVSKVPELQRVHELTDYAALTRYPGVVEDVGEDQRQEAIELAEDVVLWAERTLQLS